ncbi:MAG: T9SS type A sorting domain-containing protein [Flavobacteriia bacterium]|nr:T9SS type A sorting domain-containing protein [Flavobacteriia bacterium]
MRIVFFCILLLRSLNFFSQDESLGVIIKNYALKSENTCLEKAGSTSFDSTFIFVPDTLTLPFVDDFSTNKFQTYTYDYSGSGTTFIKEYKLLDGITSNPLPQNTQYTILPTFRRTYNIGANTHQDVNFTPLNIKLGNQNSYPTVYSTTAVYPPYYIYDTLDFPNPSDTIWLTNPDVLQDSATQFFTVINNAEKLWVNDNVYQNYRYAVEPWTLGVATFDGLDRNGKAYSLGALNPSYADFLTSKPIDISSFTASDSLYLSFLYQAGGFGDTPESIDSLVLEFYAKDLNQWFRIWSVSGSASTVFNIGHQKIVDSKYFKDGFQFRFKNYGSLAGGFDHFNLDYVHLRIASGHQDTIFKDFAFVYPIKSLLKDYTSVPWDHYKNNFNGKMSNSVEVVVRNGSNQAENNSTPGKTEIFQNNTLKGMFNFTGQSLANNDLNYSPFTTYSSLHDFSSGYHFDENTPGDQQLFDVKSTAQVIYPNLNVNDTTHTNQYFGNYYSYDDGSSEAAYGPTGIQSRLAIRFDAYESDSLIGIMSQFVESATDVSNSLFVLTVWNDNNGQPGNIVYEDEVFNARNPIYENGLNNFHVYYFKDTMKVYVEKTFYIGWRQFDANRLNIGFDKNNNNSSKNFYSSGNNMPWNPSSIPGTIMLRPVFSTALDNVLALEESEMEDENIEIYPNPTFDFLTIKSNRNINKIELFTLQGQLILESNEQVIDISNLPSGIYLLKEKGNSLKTYKVFKN